jgi:ankyrin repeat protein
MQSGSNQLPVSMDVITHLIPFIDTSTYRNLCLSSIQILPIVKSSLDYTYITWKTLDKKRSLDNVHDLLNSGRLFELVVVLQKQPSKYLAKYDANHCSLLDAAVSLGRYNMASYLVSRAFQPCVDSEVMFKCIGAHDVLGVSVLASASLPIDRFRSRDDGRDVLTCAVQEGTSEMVELFLSKGVSRPENILICALSLRDPEPEIIKKVQLLLDMGRCDPNDYSMNGHPALHVAIQDNSYISLVDVLLSHGADINLHSKCGGGGFTALDIADWKRKRSFYEHLEKQGAKHSLRYSVERESISMIAQCMDEEPPNERDLAYLICMASASGLTASVRTLVRRSNVDINNVFVRDDLTPLHVAACRGHYSACKFLIDSGINVSAKAHGGADIHRFAAKMAGSPALFQSFNLPQGSLVPPPVRVKTAAELAREAGYDRLGKLIDLSVVEAVIARRDSIDSTLSWPSTSGGNSPVTSSVIPEPHSPTIILEGLHESA